jgi:hypothetical protein
VPARAYACLQSDHGDPLLCWSDTVRLALRRRVWGQGKAAGFLVADGFAANLQMTTRRFPPPWSIEELKVAASYFPNRAPGWIVSRAFLVLRAMWKSFFICPV